MIANVLDEQISRAAAATAQNKNVDAKQQQHAQQRAAQKAAKAKAAAPLGSIAEFPMPPPPPPPQPKQPSSTSPSSSGAIRMHVDPELEFSDDDVDLGDLSATGSSSLDFNSLFPASTTAVDMKSINNSSVPTSVPRAKERRPASDASSAMSSVGSGSNYGILHDSDTILFEDESAGSDSSSSSSSPSDLHDEDFPLVGASDSEAEASSSVAASPAAAAAAVSSSSSQEQVEIELQPMESKAGLLSDTKGVAAIDEAADAKKGEEQAGSGLTYAQRRCPGRILSLMKQKGLIKSVGDDDDDVATSAGGKPRRNKRGGHKRGTTSFMERLRAANKTEKAKEPEEVAFPAPDDLTQKPKMIRVFICGPRGFTRACVASLKELNFHKDCIEMML
jgi:hypothetical protein